MIKQIVQSLKLKRVLLVMIGSMITAVGICNIHAFSDVTEGGALGLELLVFHFLGLSPAISSIIINVGCYALGWKVMGKNFLAYSAISIASYSIFYAIMEPFAPLFPWILDSQLLCALIGAIFIGVGAGLSVLGGGAPGGDDALAMSLSRRFNIKIQYVYLATDLAVLLLSLTYIPVKRIIYSLITVVISGQIVGWIQKLDKKSDI